MLTCTAPDCNNLTSLYLCTACIVDLDELLKDVDVLVAFLSGTISRTSVTAGAGTGGGGGVAGSKPPINLDAMLIKDWLRQLPRRAHGEAMENPGAGETLFMARLWVRQARDLVWGPEDKRVYGQCEEPVEGHAPALCLGRLTARPDDVAVKCLECGRVHHVSELLHRIKEKVRGEPMTPRGVREHLQAKAKMVVSKFDFENWVKHGKFAYVLDRVTTTGRPAKIYYPGDVLAVAMDMQARKRNHPGM